MSWGERSCKNKPCPIPEQCSYETCNVDCPKYEWDGITEPDSIPKKSKHEEKPFIPEEKKENPQNIKTFYFEPDFVKKFQDLADKAYELGYRLTHFPQGDLFVKGVLGFNMSGVYRWQSVNAAGNTFHWAKTFKMDHINKISEMESLICGGRE